MKLTLSRLLFAITIFACSVSANAQAPSGKKHKADKHFVKPGKSKKGSAAATAQPATAAPGENATPAPAVTTTTTAKKKKRKIRKSLQEEEYRGSGLNFKLVPALYWSSLGIEAERPIGEHISLGVNFYYRVGSTEVSYQRDSDNPTYGNQWMLEFAGKYYFTKAPKGWYAMAQFNIGDMYFQDGTTRPFAAYGEVPKFKDVNNVEKFIKPSSFRYGIGGGYQWILVPRHLTANIGLGAQFYSNDNGTQFNAYLTPSFGYIF
ncbi:MAG: hypothetical protein V4543_08715 [Bacteroidota bacterium]